MCSKKLIHSDYALFKVKEKYGEILGNKIYNAYLKNNTFYNERYLEGVKKLCKSRLYGINRYIDMLKKKHIKKGFNLYTYSEEYVVMNLLLQKLNHKFKGEKNQKLNRKFINKLMYNGISKVNISKLELNCYN